MEHGGFTRVYLSGFFDDVGPGPLTYEHVSTSSISGVNVDISDIASGSFTVRNNHGYTTAPTLAVDVRAKDPLNQYSNTVRLTMKMLVAEGGGGGMELLSIPFAPMMASTEENSALNTSHNVDKNNNKKSQSTTKETLKANNSKASREASSVPLTSEVVNSITAEPIAMSTMEEPVAPMAMSVEQTSVAAEITTISLVNFGNQEANNTYGLTGWNIPIKDAYTNYVDQGLTITVGSNGGYGYQGIKGIPRHFAEGEKVLVKVLNTSENEITFHPKSQLY